ncbi:hypothetical protein BC827DRAFT_296982 [Russula dissimulans]|nr:hypothetical protein BC827DRAFT_296982 [Russula dissimulans]
MKKLSLTLSTQSSSSSLAFPPNESQSDRATQDARSRCTSIMSTSSMLYRRDEDGSPTVPYPDGPVEILPKIWLGAEDNVRDWRGLVTRRIGSVLNVAKEVASPFELSTLAEASQLPSSEAAPDNTPLNQGAYYTADGTGRPALHYLKLQWSHGQADLVQRGFPEAMAFVDQSLARGEGVLIHCQCGISRSATLVIALVMRAASLRSPWVSQEVWDLKGMEAAYAYVKQKSKSVGPNMSLIYQLMEYDKVLRGPCGSPTPSERSRLEASADEEWSRRRKLLDEASDREDVGQEGLGVDMQREAKALDKAMEDRILARKSSSSSIGSGIGMGAAWKSRYSARKRTGSVASNMTSNSMLSENLVEEDEEQELLGVGGGFDKLSARPSPLDGQAPSDISSDGELGTTQVSPCDPTSAPATKSTFKLPPVPATALKPTFDTSRRGMSKTRRRPTPLDILPTVPDSPVNAAPTPTSLAMPRSRKESRATIPTSLQLRKSSQSTQSSQAPNTHKTTLQTPSQTLFVFPPSPNLSTCTPSTMTLTSNTVSVPFPSFPTPATPRARSDSRRRSLIGLMMPPTPTTAHARVDARGWVGIH